MKKAILTIALLVALGYFPSADSSENHLPSLPLGAVAIPERPVNALTGSEFARKIKDMPREERQNAIVVELLSGNIPDFLRILHPIEISSNKQMGGQSGMTVWVMSDYLAVGSNSDFLRVPLSYQSALKVLHRFHGVLPTKKLVDEIYQQAVLHVEPQPLPDGPSMSSVGYYLKHQRLIEAQRPPLFNDVLTSGQKKDIVLSNRLLEKENRIAIYGWHRTDGKPIQPLSIVHKAEYEDYSHGVRFVSQTVWQNGRPRSILEVLHDPESAPLLTYEGFFPEIRKMVTATN